MELTIVNKNVDFWDNKSNLAYPALLAYGFEKYESDTIPGKFIYIIANSDGSFKSPVIAGYTKVGEYPKGGYLPTENTLLQPNDEGLKALSVAYGLGWEDGAGNMVEFDYDTMKAYDTGLIPKEDFQINNSGDTIKDMVSQPYQKFNDANGDAVYTSDGDRLWVLKTF